MEINYKLKTEKEEYNIYNEKVIKLKTTYSLKLNLPYWIDGFFFFNFFPCTKIKRGDDLCCKIKPEIDMQGDGLDRRRIYEITFTVYTMSKCDDKDKFDETKGLHICETKAEIKALKIVNKFINIIRDKVNLYYDLNKRLDIRLEKNKKHLIKLSK